MGETFGISHAVKEMRDGKRVRRTGWNVALQIPDANSKMSEPYVYLRTAQGTLIPWNCSQADLLAMD